MKRIELHRPPFRTDFRYPHNVAFKSVLFFYCATNIISVPILTSSTIVVEDLWCHYLYVSVNQSVWINGLRKLNRL